jgi:hypothetical protein
MAKLILGQQLKGSIMTKFSIAMAAFSILITNIVYAYPSQIKCSTGYFSSKSFIIKVISTQEFCTDEEEIDGICWFSKRPCELRELFSMDGDLLDSQSVTGMYCDSAITFSWKEDGQRFSLWKASNGWAINSHEKDWSSSEGDHWDKVLEKTYCK